MQPVRSAAPLRMWGQPNDSPPPEWRWVEQQLRDAGTYWMVSRPDGYPHPRPVWGVWIAEQLLLSVGSRIVTAEVEADPRVTVHLDSGTDVVILEGNASVVTEPDVLSEFTSAYNTKYDWEYAAERDGPPTRIEPVALLSWQAAGPAGRDGFPRAARWQFR